MVSSSDRSRYNLALQAALARFGHRPTINGIDLGYKVRNEERTGEVAVRFYVCCKQPAAELPPDQRIPPVLEGVATDVLEATCTVLLPIEKSAGRGAQEAHRQRQDPLQPGLSISRLNGPAGTLGAVVYDNATGAPALLSNWHVLVGQGGHMGDPVLQPAHEDGARPETDVVGRVERQVLGLQGDAAIAVLTGQRSGQSQPLGAGVLLCDARAPQLGEVLRKSGRTSGVTAGRVDGIGRYFLDYPVGRLGIDGFMLVPVDGWGEISAGGDSGAVWFDPATGEGVGLHMAGDAGSQSRSEYAVACHLGAVLAALDVSLMPRPLAESPAVAELSELAAAWVGSSRPWLDQLRRLLEGASGVPEPQLQQIRGCFETPGCQVLFQDGDGLVEVVLEGGQLQLKVHVSELLPLPAAGAAAAAGRRPGRDASRRTKK